MRSLGADAPPLYYVTMPQGVMREVVDAAVADGWTPLADVGFWGIEPDAFGIGAKPPTFVVDVRRLGAAEAGRAPLPPDADGARQSVRAHRRSRQARRLLGLEHFRRAPTESRWESIIEQLGEPVPSS